MPKAAYIIPEHVDPFRFAEQHAHLKGIIPLAQLTRLGSWMTATEGTVEADIHFDIDEQGTPIIYGKLATQVTLQCQRCMDPYSYEIMVDFMSGVVKSEDKVSHLPGNYNPVVVKENVLALRDLIEDELILSIPIVPKHAPEECKVQMPYKDPDQDNEKANPFYILKQPGKRKSKKSK